MIEASKVPMTELVSTKLCKMLGEARGHETVRALLGVLGKPEIQTPDDMKFVATELIGRGGLVKMIGHSIMVEAMLRGAGQQVGRAAPK
jgi:hypothetical protein